MHHTLGGQIPGFEKVFESALGDDGRDPIACVHYFWRHCERKPKGKKNCRFKLIGEIIVLSADSIHSGWRLK